MLKALYRWLFCKRATEVHELPNLQEIYRKMEKRGVIKAKSVKVEDSCVSSAGSRQMVEQTTQTAIRTAAIINIMR